MDLAAAPPSKVHALLPRDLIFGVVALEPADESQKVRSAETYEADRVVAVYVRHWDKAEAFLIVAADSTATDARLRPHRVQHLRHHLDAFQFEVLLVPRLNESRDNRKQTQLRQAMQVHGRIVGPSNAGRQADRVTRIDNLCRNYTL